MSNKAQFNNIEIVNMKFEPFRDKHVKGVEFELLDDISKSILNIRNKLRRRHVDLSDGISFNFSKSNTLIAIDIASLRSEESSFVEHLYYVIYLYPFICINSNLSINDIKKMRLHEVLSEKGYVLPIFPIFSPYDVLYSSKRYGDEIQKLIAGDIRELNISELKGINVKYSIDDILNHFQNLYVKDGKLLYHVNVAWLGAKEGEMGALLDHLFNENKEKFSLSEMCSKFSIKRETINKYISGRKMLFDLVNEDEVIFRLTRKNIIGSVKSALSQEFEDNLYKYSVIDTSDAVREKFKAPIKEVHELGKLFNSSDQTYPIKLLSLLRSSLNDLEFDRVILIDNGYEDNLYEYLGGILNKPVSRIINSMDKPQQYPFDEYPLNQKVIIFIDICNTGSFLDATVEYLNAVFGYQISAVISIIISKEFDMLTCRKKQCISRDYRFIYFLEKELHNVKALLQKKHFDMRNARVEERFMFFWHLMDRVADIKLQSSPPIIEEATAGELVRNVGEIASVFSSRVVLSADVHDKIKPEEDISGFIRSIIVEKKIDACVVNSKEDSRSFPRLLSKIDNSIIIYTIDYDQPPNDLAQLLSKHKNILLFNVAFNLGLSTLRLLNYLNRQDAKLLSRIIGLFLFSRKNIIDKNQHIVEMIRRQINQYLNERQFVYYDSSIPFSCFDMSGNSSDKNIVRRLKEV